MDEGEYHKHLPVGAVVFHEGEAGDCAYILQQGEVVLSTQINGQTTEIAVVRR